MRVGVFFLNTVYIHCVFKNWTPVTFLNSSQQSRSNISKLWYKKSYIVNT